MAGIYIHIPLCATRCIYCDFYSTTLREHGSELVRALRREMEERADFLHEPVRTVYLGGGTPSQLGSDLLAQLLAAVEEHYDLSQCEEVTLEANPEDIPTLKLPARVNRVSMGVQSMVDAELRLLNRRHNSQRVCEAVAALRQVGIRNLSLDLMYGLPTQTLESWAYSIDQVLSLDPEHISAYNLSVEEGTRLHRMVERGDLTVCDDDTCLRMAALLRDRLKDAGYVQYEISNYAKPGFESRHNSSYWVQTPYIGLGPGAHSYDGERRRSWNAPDLVTYLNNSREEDYELLSDTDLYNERLMLGLRTAQGIDLEELRSLSQLLNDNTLEPTLASLLERGLIRFKDVDMPSGQKTYVSLSHEGLALADEVIRELMVM